MLDETLTRRRTRYPIIGALLALGAPVGLLWVRAVSEGRLPTRAWSLEQITSDPATYAYAMGSSLFVFVALGWSLGRREDALEATSITDPLTGLWNRRHLDERLFAEVQRSVRYGSPLAVLLIDLDGLKAINDRAGHTMGDASLRRVATALRGTCRATDIAARYGGDEFVVVAPSTHPTDAADLAERLCSAVRGLAAVRARDGIPLSVSIGVAGTPGHVSITAEALVASADRALYEAKSGGRDRVVLAPPVAGEPTSRASPGKGA